MSSQRGFSGGRGGRGGRDDDWDARDAGFGRRDTFDAFDDSRGVARGGGPDFSRATFGDDGARFARRERGGVSFGDDGFDDRYGDMGSDRRRETNDSDSFVSVECAGQEGRIIGKGGEKIREIQERTGAHLSVRKELGVVEVEGGDVRAAEREIRQLVEDGRRSDATRGYGAAERDARRESPPDKLGSPGDDGYGDGEYYDDDDLEDDDWILEGLEDELADAAAWAGGVAGSPSSPGRYRPAAMSKYVDDDFEPMVYTREPDDADEYNFFAGSRFKQLGATPGVEAALAEMGIERHSHIQALTYKALAEDAAEETREERSDDAGAL